MSAHATGNPATATYEAIRYAQADGVATVTLNRPDVHNAMNQAMRRELLEVFTHLRTDSYGAKSVSLSTTSAVVLSCVMILIADYVVTSFLM